MMSTETMKVTDSASETIKEIILDKSDLPGAAGASVTGTIWGLTQSEVAAVMTILIGIAIIAHKFVLIWIALKEHKLKFFKKNKH